MTTRQDLLIVTGMTLRWTHEANRAVSMLVVVPSDELTCPRSCSFQIRKAEGWELRPILRCSEQRLDERVVITHARPRVRGLDAQPVQHGEHRRRLHRCAVVAVENGFSFDRMDAFAQRRSSRQIDRMIGAVGLMNLEAHDLATVNIQDQVQVKPLTQHSAREERQIPAPQLRGAVATCLLGGLLR